MTPASDQGLDEETIRLRRIRKSRLRARQYLLRHTIGMCGHRANDAVRTGPSPSSFFLDISKGEQRMRFLAHFDEVDSAGELHRKQRVK
jgi:hypothetical protein